MTDFEKSADACLAALRLLVQARDMERADMVCRVLQKIIQAEKAKTALEARQRTTMSQTATRGQNINIVA